MTERVLECAERDRAVPGELELRLGRWDGGQFVSGVSKEVFGQLERDFMDSTLEGEVGWKEFMDYHYSLPRGGRARTRIEFDSQRMELRPQHISKEAQSSVVLQRPDDAEACRLAWSHEVPLEMPPTTCMPTYVRIQQRRRFVDRRDGRVVWAYDLSKTWSASSRSAVEYLQHHSEPTYEVECEFVDEGGEYGRTHSRAHLAKSLSAKACLLLGEDPQTTALEEVGIRMAGKRVASDG